MGPLATPKKGREGGSADAWSPTSNLKILISAASPDIRNREKELGQDVARKDVAEQKFANCLQDVEDSEDGEKVVSRKKKSLGLLCHKFLARYPDFPGPSQSFTICLDDVATELHVERRRIYDIMNVLESLHMVSRSAKNRYAWHGRTNLQKTLAILKTVGEAQKYSQQMELIRQRPAERDFDPDGEEKENQEMVVVAAAEEESDVDGQGQKELNFVELPGVEFKAASVNSRKDKSLRVMSQKFIMLFLVSQPRVVSQDIAAKILIGEDKVEEQDKNKFKTKVRRLYDIANVLQSLKLIEKVHVTDERGRKLAFQWVGPEDFPSVKGADEPPLPPPPPPEPKRKVLEPRTENCAKRLFSSPGTKRGFTRHPSLIKLAKSIQDDRRKINSAPSSPAKMAGDPSNGEIPNKMAQLAAICKIQLDRESATASKHLTPTTSVDPASAPLLTPPQDSTVHAGSSLTPSRPTAAATTVSLLPAQCSPLIPVLLPQQGGRTPYAVFLQPSALRSHMPARPQPSSTAVRSMTFEDKVASPAAAKSQAAMAASDGSQSGLKRTRAGSTPESSPAKARRPEPGSKDSTPKIYQILQARLKSNGEDAPAARPAPRVLHLDPEFLNAAVVGCSQGRGSETSPDGEGGLTPLRAVPLTPGQLHAETLVPAGYLIPITQQPLLSCLDLQGSNGDNATKALTPTYGVFHVPTAGSKEATPPSVRLHRTAPASATAVASSSSPHAASARRLHSPSPAILNFTLQNMGLISGSAPGGGAFAAPQTPNRADSPLALQPRGLVFVRPVSPAPVHQAVPSHPVTLLSVSQPLVTTPPPHTFFHTPVPPSPLAAVVPGGGRTATRAAYVPQRKLDVSQDDA